MLNYHFGVLKEKNLNFVNQSINIKLVRIFDTIDVIETLNSINIKFNLHKITKKKKKKKHK
jgi:hypothetical protein